MYSKQEASILRQQFWTSLGQYLAPIPSASGDKINWINYKTGNKFIHFKMDATDHAYIGIEIFHKDRETKDRYYNHFKTLKAELESALGEKWVWQQEALVNGKPVSRIFHELAAINIFRQTDWPQMISFLKSRMIALDRFWTDNKEIFEMLG